MHLEVSPVDSLLRGSGRYVVLILLIWILL